MSNPLDRLARRQYGLATTQQIKETCGDSALRRMKRRGEIERIHFSVYRLRGTSLSWHQSAMAAILATPAGTVLSHGAAARLVRLPGFENAEVELSVDVHTRIRLLGVGSHRRNTAFEVSHIDGLPVTTALQTLTDLAPALGTAQLRGCLDHALVNRSLTAADVHAFMTPSRRGQPGAAILRLATEQLLANEIESPLEAEFYRKLQSVDVPQPCPQYEVKVRANTYRLDFAWPAARVAVEVDGYRFHAGRQNFDDDRRRGNALTGDGWILLHYTSQSDWPAFSAQLERLLRAGGDQDGPNWRAVAGDRRTARQE